MTLEEILQNQLEEEFRSFGIEVWNAAIESAARAAIDNGDLLEIHSPGIARK